jgi:hypothetical protein
MLLEYTLILQAIRIGLHFSKDSCDNSFLVRSSLCDRHAPSVVTSLKIHPNLSYLYLHYKIVMA